MNKLLNALKEENNYTYTENGAITHSSTLNALYDMFALGGAYRSRSEADCILLFKNALEENETYALKCLFYLRDVRGGQGERRFWRVCMKWLAKNHSDIARRTLLYVAEFGRYDDYYVFVDTPLEDEMFGILRGQYILDLECKTPSLLAKWLKSENTSSAESQYLGMRTRKAFGLSPRQYRKSLSLLRERIRVVERLMSANRWDEIEFDKIPSKAGLIYRNAFARRDIIKAKYEAFITSADTKVNAGTLYPYDVVSKAIHYVDTYERKWDLCNGSNEVERAAINKYWDNLKDYFNGATLDALCVVDTSGSMCGSEAAAPINVAISLGLYAAERARGPFAGHYISFSSKPQLIKTEGIDFVDKVKRIYETNLCEDTNIEATFDMLLNTAIRNHCSQDDLPKTIVIISDMEFNSATGHYYYSSYDNDKYKETLMEGIRNKWIAAGYKMPKLVFWNVQARNNNIPMRDEAGITFVSGASAVTFEMVLSGKTAQDLMFDKLNSKRYECIK